MVITIWNRVPFLFSYRGDRIIYVWYQNFALRVDKFAHEVDQIGHRLENCPSEHPRMKILSRSGNRNVVVRDAAESVS